MAVKFVYPCNIKYYSALIDVFCDLNFGFVEDGHSIKNSSKAAAISAYQPRVTFGYSAQGTSQGSLLGTVHRVPAKGHYWVQCTGYQGSLLGRVQCTGYQPRVTIGYSAQGTSQGSL